MKSFIYKFFLSGSLLATLVTACNTEDFSLSGDKTAAKITAGVGFSETAGLTRAADAAWGMGDHIGITMLEYPLPAQTSGQPPVGVVSGYSNQDYVTTAGDGVFSPNPATNIMYYPINGDAATFKAYYPYSNSLSANFIKAVDVTSQNNLADIDLMTAVHTNGSNSKDHPDVNLKFYHRLAKVIINLDAETPIDLTGCQLVLKGMKTTGSYDLIGDGLAVNTVSGADIAIPVKLDNTKLVGQGILLPRAAGTGVTFQVTTANGGVYTATMDNTLELKSGYKYTFNVHLKTTPTEVTATIEPWADGTESSMDVVRLVTGLGTNADFKNNDQIKLYLKDTKTSIGGTITNPEFALAGTFTYNETSDVWTPLTPLYWENIYGDPVEFRGTSVLATKLNNTQMDDILISDNTAVNQYKGVNLAMKHAGSKLTVELKSTDGTFSAADLAGAVITLPGYLNSGTLNATTGAFEIGGTTGNITPKDGVSIFPPQTITTGNNVVTVVVNGRTYEVPAASPGFLYAKGTAYKMTLDLKKANVVVSTTITPWTIQDLGTKTITIGTENLSANGGDLQDGDKLQLYTSSGAVPGYFEHTSSGSVWNFKDDLGSPANLYWENIENTGYLYASITRPEINATPSYNQSKDYITATPVVNDGGKSNTAINFQMFHRVAKIRVKLTSTIYTDVQLNAAMITLPNYKIGGIINNGIYTEGSSVGTITLGPLSNTEASAYLPAQTVTTGSTVVLVAIAGRQYTVTFPSNVEYKAGQATNLIINIEPSDLKVSVNVTGWTEETNNLALSFTSTAASASGFENNDQIKFYKISGNNVTATNTTYKYAGDVNSGTLTPATTTWYRDDSQTGEKITAVFPASASSLTSGNTFSWTCKSSGTTNSHQDDIMVAAPSGSDGIIVAGSANVSLNFKHVLSKITVNLFNGDGFTAPDVSPSVINLVNFKLSGTVDVVNGTATATGAATGSFAPTKLSTANTVQGIGTAVASYEAFIMPQVIGTVGSKTAIVTVGLNGQTYNAEIERYDFKAGENHVFNITLKKTGLIFSATVAPWQNGAGGSITIL